MIVTFDTSILVRATKRSNGPARRAVDVIASDAVSGYRVILVALVFYAPPKQFFFRKTPNKPPSSTIIMYCGVVLALMSRF